MIEQEDQRRRALTLLGYASFLLIGWAGVLVPALIRPIEDAFDQSDAGIGAFYLIFAAFAALGQASGGLLTERVGRRTVLVSAGLLLGIGFAALALAPTWAIFMAAAIPAGLGGGAIDGGVNGLFLALHPRSRGGALNRLHLFFAIGALVAPFVAGRLVIAGIAWAAVLIVTAGVALAVALFFGIVEMPSGRFAGAASAAVEPSIEPAPRPEAGVSRPRERRVAVDAWPFAFLALGIGSYVAAEIGVSNWVVRFFDSAPLDVATGSLSLFWGGLTAGRLLSSAIADRFDPVAFAAGSVGLAAAALVGAVLAPSVPLSIALFALGGVCFGPVYPMIMVVGGTLYPRRLAAVSGGLGGAAVVGGTLYPPLVGLISVQVGIGAGMLGAGLLSIVCAVALVGASLVARRLAVSPTEAG